MSPVNPNEKSWDEVTLNEVWDSGKVLARKAWGKTSRRMRVTAGILVFLAVAIYLSLPRIQELPTPHVSLEYRRSPYNESKVALLIENRPLPLLAPLMLHFMSVVPPDWRFRFMGSVRSVAHINQSVAIRERVASGKLDLTYIPSNMTTNSGEEISRFLTNLWLYEVLLQPAEWLLVFQTDSILCANSRHSLNDFLEYDWVGAPWNPNGRFGGNGGLSLRRVSTMIDILREQERVDGSEPEDVWLTERLGHRPSAKMANGTTSLLFSGEMNAGNRESVKHGPELAGKFNSTLEAAKAGEFVEGIDDWREGQYEPMGYHTGSSGNMLHGGIWGTPEMRKHVWKYCPEVKMTLKMDAAKFVPGSCNANWKRSAVDLGYVEPSKDGPGYVPGSNPDIDLGWGTEIIDGEEYPLLPPNLTPW